MKALIRIPAHIRRKQGGWVAIPYIIAATAIAGAGAAAVQSRNQGIATQNNAAMQARVEGDAAKQQEIQRRQNLMRALSSQNASAASAGITTDGSLGAGLRRQINQNQNDLLVTDANTTARQSMLAAQGSNARASGNLGAVASILDGAGKSYNAMPGGTLVSKIDSGP